MSSPDIATHLGNTEYPTSLNPAVFRFITGMAARLLKTTEEFAPGALEEIVDHRQNNGSILISSAHQKQWDPGVIGGIVERHQELHFLLDKTGIIAKSDLWENPLTHWLVTRSNCVAVLRPSKNESTSESATRQNDNNQQMVHVAEWVNDGGHVLIYVEGGTKEENEDGKRQTVPSASTRKIKPGIGKITSLMTPEQLERLRIWPISTVYTGGLVEAALGGHNQFTYMGNLLVPSSDPTETVRIAQQGLEQTMTGAVELAIRTKLDVDLSLLRSG